MLNSELPAESGLQVTLYRGMNGTDDIRFALTMLAFEQVHGG